MTARSAATAAAFMLALSALPALAAPMRQASLFVQPARVDFDHDGRADTAAGVLTSPDVVRVTLSRTGIHDIMQPADVVAIAGFDYDRDGDVDLLVGTSKGAVIWVNDGHGGFSALPRLLPAAAPPDTSSAWSAIGARVERSAERNEPAAARDSCLLRAARMVRFVVRGPSSCIIEFVPSLSVPRAPPSA